MIINYDMIIPACASITMVVIAYRIFFGKFEPQYIFIAMLTCLTTSFFHLLKNPSVFNVAPVLIELFVIMACCFIHVKRRKEAQLNISTHKEKDYHYCNVLSASVVCFERNGELWVKEYVRHSRDFEGRTYMVFYCPWCGYQTEKSKMHEKVQVKFDRR